MKIEKIETEDDDGTQGNIRTKICLTIIKK
jgi:hypothetical protein